MKLLIATQNPGKKQEFRSLLSDLKNIEIVFLDDVNLTGFEFPEESGSTFHQNAQIKAQSLAEFTNIPSIADDSGLSITSLNGFPGVISARWLAGSDRDRSQGILSKLENEPDRSATFVCSICFFDPSKTEAVFFNGIQSGEIATSIQGNDGFGYDPIFIPDGENKTYAELGMENKNQFSHRAKALAKFKEFLQQSMLD